MKRKNIFQASEIDSKLNGWIVDLSGPHAVNPDCYFHFNSKKRAEEFMRRVENIDDGDDAKHIYQQMIEQSSYAAALGSIKSDRKAASSAANGKKGGRPKKQNDK